MNDCLFCKIVAGEIPCVKVYDDARVIAFEDVNPVSDGHTLVIPKAHAENVWEISKEDLAAVHAASVKISGAMKSSLNAEGVLCVQLNGRPVGQMIMHYHLHLIPRLIGAKPLPLTHWELVPGNMDRIREIGKKIEAGISHF